MPSHLTAAGARCPIVGVQVKSRIYPLRLPLQPDEQGGWNSSLVFSESLGGRANITCHTSVLLHGVCPHPPTSHAEEELLLVLSGEVDLLFSRRDPAHLRVGEFVYYPAHFSHTLQTTSTEPATYVVFKWRRESAADPGGAPQFGLFDTAAPPGLLPLGLFDTAAPPGLLFQAPTRHLGQLHSHVTVLEPGDGYPPHTDAYDVAIVVLAGEVETIGARAEPHHVIYYAAGEAHGMENVGDVSARYVVFEFHGRG